MSSCLHRAPLRQEWGVRAGAHIAAVPGLDRVASHAARLVFRPSKGPALSARGNPAARDLVRHATMDLGGNGNRARAWSKAIRRWPREQPELMDAYRLIEVPVLLLWADEDPAHPLGIAEEARDLLPDAILRVLSGTGFLMAYDDPVGLARELAAFCT
jgi:pimeloyl-ACP methyl ester carboxylesterase